jgi:hypothetical protein
VTSTPCPAVKALQALDLFRVLWLASVLLYVVAGKRTAMEQDAIMMLIIIVTIPLISILALKIVGKQKRTRRPIHRYRPEP